MDADFFKLCRKTSFLSHRQKRATMVQIKRANHELGEGTNLESTASLNLDEVNDLQRKWFTMFSRTHWYDATSTENFVLATIEALRDMINRI